MLTAYKEMLQNFFNFKGRTSRRNFWFAWLCHMIIVTGYFLVCQPVVFNISSLNQTIVLIIALLLVIIGYVLIIAYFALIIRRIRDTGRPWYYFFISAIPIAGFVILIYILTRPSAN